MNLLNNLPHPSRTMVRRISLFNLIVPSVVMFLVCRKLLLMALLCHILMSSTILLMIPDTFNDMKFTIAAGVSVLVLSISVDIVSVAAESLSVLMYAYPLVGAVPLLVCVFHRVRLMMNTPSYLIMKISGWELMLCGVKVSFLLLFMVVSDVVLRLSFTSSKWYAYGFSLLASFALYAVLYVRSITSGPIISFTRAGIPHGERDVGTCAYMPKASRIDYSLMYEKLRRLMKEKKPFLNPDYSLDELVRTMISNKAYVSRLIHTCTGLNFSQMINKYRIDYAMELYAANLDLKVKDLAYLSGFHSQVTFNMAFKLFHDVTPGVWCKAYKDDVRPGIPLSSQEESERSDQQVSCAQGE